MVFDVERVANSWLGLSDLLPTWLTEKSIDSVLFLGSKKALAGPACGVAWFALSYLRRRNRFCHPIRRVL